MSKRATQLQMSPKDIQHLDTVVTRNIEHPKQTQIAVLQTLAAVLDSARSTLRASDDPAISTKPATILHSAFKWLPRLANVPVRWFEAEYESVVTRSYNCTDAMSVATETYADWYARSVVLRELTNQSEYFINGGTIERLIPDALFETIFKSAFERQQRIEEAFRPVSLGTVLTRFAEESATARPNISDRQSSNWVSDVVLGQHTWSCSIFAVIEPIVFHGKALKGFFPVDYAISLPKDRLKRLGLWSKDNAAFILDGLRSNLEAQINSLRSVGTMGMGNDFSQRSRGESVSSIASSLDKLVSEFSELKHALASKTNEKSDPEQFASVSIGNRDSVESKSEPPPQRVRWNINFRDLYLDDKLIKHFRSSAKMQTQVLDEFQRKNWITTVTPALKPDYGSISLRSRLKGAIRELNEDLNQFGLHFDPSLGGRGVSFSISKPA